MLVATTLHIKPKKQWGHFNVKMQTLHKQDQQNKKSNCKLIIGVHRIDRLLLFSQKRQPNTMKKNTKQMM